MKKKIFKTMIILSFLHYFAVVICGAVLGFTFVPVFSEYSFKAFLIISMYILYNYGCLIPLCIAFQLSVIFNIFIKKFNLSADMLKALSFISVFIAIVISVFLTILFVEFYENGAWIL